MAKLQYLLLLLLIMAVGCQPAFRSNLPHPIMLGQPTVSPQNRSAPASANNTISSSQTMKRQVEQQRDPLANHRMVLTATKNFEKAARDASQSDMNAFQRDKVIKAAADCERDLHYIIGQSAYPQAATYEVETSQGRLSLLALKDRCSGIADELQARKVPGCGFRRVDVESLSLGGGRWSAPEVIPRRGYYSAEECSEMPRGHSATPNLRRLVPVIARTCKGGTPIVDILDENWSTNVLVSGQILREVTATCWIKGERSDWGDVLE